MIAFNRHAHNQTLANYLPFQRCTDKFSQAIIYGTTKCSSNALPFMLLETCLLLIDRPMIRLVQITFLSNDVGTVLHKQSFIVLMYFLV